MKKALLILAITFAAAFSAFAADTPMVLLSSDMVLEPVFFSVGSSELDAAGAAACARNALRVRDHAGPLDYVVVVGHADSSGKSRRNKRLSEARAASVLSEYRRLGLTNLASESKGVSALFPVCKQRSSACKGRNRKADTIILTLQVRDNSNTGGPSRQ